MRRTVEICVSLFAATVTLVASQKPFVYSENKTRHDSQTVLLGGLFPISENEDNECGKLRTSAVEAVEAMVFTIKRINEDRTLLPNVNLTFDIRDTCSIPNKGLEMSLSYVQAPVSSTQTPDDLMAVSGIVGAGFFSHVSMAVASLFRLFQIPQISYGSSAAELSDRVRFDYFFRTLPSDAFLARAIGDAVNYFNWSYVFALHSDDTFGTSGLSVTLDIIRQDNATRKCVAQEISMPLAGTDADYDNIVERMNQPWVRNATVALIYGYRSQATGIMKAIERLMFKDPNTPLQHLTWVGCEALLQDKQYHYLVHGMVRMEYKVNTSYLFQKHFTSLTPTSESSNPYLPMYWEAKFNCSLSGQHGRRSCSNFTLTDYLQKSEIASLIDAVYAFAHTIHGLIEQHCPDKTLCSMITVRRSAGMAVNGTMIRDYLLSNLSFPGLSADVVDFDADGNDQSSYVIFNLQQQSDGTYAYKDVGTWDPLNRIQFTNRVEWNNDDEILQSICSLPCKNGSFTRFLEGTKCCWTCDNCPGDNTVSTGVTCDECKEGYSPNSDKSQCTINPTSYLTWSDPWGIVIVITTCIGLLATGTVAAVFVIFHNHKVIKASSRELSTFLLAGLILCYLLPFLYLARPSIAICTLRRFFLGLSFSVCFSALLVKTNRIHRLFNRSPEQMKQPPRLVSPLSQVIITLILISFQVLIAALWLSSIEHPDTTYTKDRTVTELRCGESPVITLVVSLGYNLLLLILSTYFAFLARRIPENFNEAKYINVTLYTVIIIWFAFIPTFLATADLGTIYQTSSLVIAIILSASTTLCCLFAPKMFLLASKFSTEKEKDSIPTTTNFVVANSSTGTTKASEMQAP